MQLPRIIIAGVFLILGVAIAVPALLDTRSTSGVTSAPTTTAITTTATATATATATGSASPGPTSPTATPTTRSGSPRPTTPTPTASPTTTRPPAPTPTSTATSATTAPVQPLEITIGKAVCPARTVTVTIRNTGSRTEDYTVETGKAAQTVADRIEPGLTRRHALKLTEDLRTRVVVTWHNEPALQRTRTADCKGAGGPSPDDSPEESLPHTGPEDGLLWARLITGGAAMLTGGIIFWYGGIWPRRRDPIFGDKSAG